MVDCEPEALKCDTCERKVTVAGGFPRFVDELSDESLRRTQASFGYEWTHFSDWEPSGEVNFEDYFQGLDLSTLRTAGSWMPGVEWGDMRD